MKTLTPPSSGGISAVAAATDYNSGSRGNGLIPVWDADTAKLLHKAIVAREIVIAAADSPVTVKAAALATGGTICDAIDDDLDIEAALAISQATTNVAGSATGATAIALGPGTFRLGNTVTCTSAPIRGMSTPNNGTRVLWDGSAADTAFVKTTDTGATSFWEFCGINFREGTADPNYWLDITAAHVDQMFKLHDLHFKGGVSGQIKMGGWVNCHWRDLRFDDWGGYAIDITATVSMNKSTFALDMFTCDNQPSTTANGFIRINATASASFDLGTFRLSSPRCEINTALLAPSSLIHLIEASPGSSRCLGFHFVDFTYDDVAGNSADYLVYLETAATNLSVSVKLSNVRQNGLLGIVGGNLSSTYPTIPVQAHYGTVDIAQNSTGPSLITDLMQIRAYGASGTPFSQYRGAESFARLAFDDTGKVTWGSGSVAGDTTLYRSAADTLKTDDSFHATGALHSLAVATKTASATLTTAEQTVIGNGTAGSITLTLPTAVGNTGKTYHIKRIHASNSVVVDPNGAQTIDGAATKTLGSQYAELSIFSDGANWLILSQLGTIT